MNIRDLILGSLLILVAETSMACPTSALGQGYATAMYRGASYFCTFTPDRKQYLWCNSMNCSGVFYDADMDCAKGGALYGGGCLPTDADYN